MCILDRIRANGGEVVRDKWSITLRRGKLSNEALLWLKRPEVRERLLHEVWPEYDDWQERAAIREFDGGMSREDAEAAAYDDVMAWRGDDAQLLAA